MGVLTSGIKQFIREQRLGTISTVSREGVPCASPLGSVIVLDDETVVWADVRSPRTVSNITSNSKVEIILLDPVARKAVRLTGRGAVLRNPASAEMILRKYRESGSKTERVRSLVAVLLDRAEILRSPAYDDGLNEQDIKSLWQEYFSRQGLRTIRDLIPPQDF